MAKISPPPSIINNQGSDSNNNPEGEEGDDAQGGHEVSGGFIVSRGDSAKILESAKHAFNSVSLFVCVFAVLDRRFTAASSRNDAGALTAV